MSKQRNVFLVGLMGVGKTSIGRCLATQLNLVFYDSDQVVEERCGADIPWIFDVEGERGFRDREVAVIQELTKLDNIVLSTGGSTVLREENRSALKAHGVVIYLRASVDVLAERTRYSRKRPLLLNQNHRDVLSKLIVEREPLYEQVADYVYSTQVGSMQDVCKKIVNDLVKQESF